MMLTGRMKEATKAMSGSLTVEAAIIFPVVLCSIFLMVQQGIVLYTQTVKMFQRQEMWEEFSPEEQFRRLDLIKDIF